MWSNSTGFKKQKGQSLIEVLVVLAITSIMLVALIMIILASLKNAQFAQNQTQATKLAQNTIDQIRILRDNNKNGTLDTACFVELWNTSTHYCTTADCYYRLTTLGDYLENKGTTSFKDSLGGGFSRQIKISQPIGTNIKLTVEVFWTDSSGEHSSNLETVLTKVDYDCAD